MIKAVLFDLDGTLVDSRDAVVWCVNELLGRHGLPPVPKEAIIPLIGVGLTPLLGHFLPDPDRYVPEYRRLYRKGFASKTHLYPGAKQLLALLKKKGIKTGVITNRWRELTVAILLEFELESIIDDIIADGEGFPLKPDPAMILEACRRFDLSPSEILMVGDTAIDVDTARNAGSRSVLVVHEGEPVAASPDHMVKSLPEILDLIR